MLSRLSGRSAAILAAMASPLPKRVSRLEAAYRRVFALSHFRPCLRGSGSSSSTSVSIWLSTSRVRLRC